jgi:NAD(P)-dependent dehydrogenase (short-subunit alcohol dehydrogenase family)
MDIPSNASKGRLAGKVAIITDAGAQGNGVGTGMAMSVLFAREGASVCLIDAELTRAEQTLQMINREGGEGVVVEGDVSEATSCASIIEEVNTRYGKLDILINNTTMVGPTGPVDGLDEHEWNTVLRVNLTSAMLMSKYALPKLMSDGGAIVNISSTGALISTGQTPAYGASKAALLRLTADMAAAYGRKGVRVNAIAPGHIYTPLAERERALTSDERAQRAKGSALGTEGDAWDVAWAALFLASDEARWITGTCLPIDGGMTQTNPFVIHRWLSE